LRNAERAKSLAEITRRRGQSIPCAVGASLAEYEAF
jgi:hypothetical protein